MDGKKIQIRKMGSHQGFRDGKWYDVENPRWDFDSCDYRVSPEPPKPREWDVYEISGCITSFEPVVQTVTTNYGESQWKSIKVREVIE